MARLMAFDYGLIRTGIAVTDTEQIIATALDTVETKKLSNFLKQYLEKEQVDAFVIGYPYNHGHFENSISKEIDHFILSLEKQFPGKKTSKVDERFTSLIASQVIAQSGMKRIDRQKKGNVDKVSAVLILQSFMENHEPIK